MSDPLSGAEREVLRCLFFHGPREDGDIPSKVGRGDLYHRAFVGRGHGWNWLTSAGTDYAIATLGMDREKERWLRERQQTQVAIVDRMVELKQQLRVHE